MEILSINTLDIGQKLTNIELYVILGCSNSGSMRRAKKTNSLIIISSHVESIYEDRWDGDVLLYMSLYIGYDSEKLENMPKSRHDCSYSEKIQQRQKKSWICCLFI